MLFLEPLDAILGHISKVKILRFLIRSQAELNGREIAKAVGVSHVRCHTALQELSTHGFITMRRVGRSVLYRLESENILVERLLKPLFDNESRILDDFLKILLGELSLPKPVSIALFGSIVKGKMRPDSDIDILVVVPNEKDIRQARRDVDRAEEKIVKIFGNRLASIIIKENIFQKRYRKKEALLVEIVKTGKVIYGKPLSELLI